MEINKNYFKVGDTCHVFHGHHRGETTPGKVVNVFDIDNHLCNPHYVISVDGNNGISDELIVRSSFVLEIRKEPTSSTFDSKDADPYDADCEEFHKDTNAVSPKNIFSSWLRKLRL